MLRNVFRRTPYTIFLFCLLTAVVVTGCSLYESTGRKAIEDNENDVVGTYSLNANRTLAYRCAVTTQSPNFLREPMEAIATPYESEDITTLIDVRSSPVILAMEKVMLSGQYASCRIRFLTVRASTITPRDIAKAAHLGHAQILNIEVQHQKGGVAHGPST